MKNRSWQEKKALLEKVCGYVGWDPETRVGHFTNNPCFSVYFRFNCSTEEEYVGAVWTSMQREVRQHMDSRAGWDRVAHMFRDDL